MRRYLDGWEEYRFEIEDLAEVGPGKVVGICRERGKPKDGTPVDRRFGGLWIVEGGKITSWATYLTPREAVRAAKELLGGRVQLDQIKRTAPPAAVKPVEPAPVAQPEPEPAGFGAAAQEAADEERGAETRGTGPRADAQARLAAERLIKKT